MGYVNTKKPPYKVDYVGWWPDPLLNYLQAFDLDDNVWQPVWLDIHAPAGQAAGLYRGTVTVTADGMPPMPPLKVPLETTVWNFALPATYHFPLAVVFWDDMLRSVYSKDTAVWQNYAAYCRGAGTEDSVGTGEARRLLNIRRKCHDLILAHHLIPDNIYRATPPRIDDVKRWKDHGARWFNILHVSSVGHLKAGDPYPAEAKQRILATLADYVPRLEKEGLLGMAYIYGFDEISPNQFAAMKEGHLWGHQETLPEHSSDHYGLRSLLWPGHRPGRLRGCLGAADTKIRFDGGGHCRSAAARPAGVVVCLLWSAPPVCQLVRGVHRRRAPPAHGLHAAEVRLSGVLALFHEPLADQSHRASAGRPDGAAGERPVHRGDPSWPLTNSDGKSWTEYNGDGLIFYPGPEGPVPTIRMKCIRDGLEDYEYLWLLKERLEKARNGTQPASLKWQRQAEAALAVDPALVRSLTEYSTRGEDLLKSRRTIARLLSKH